MKIPHFRKEKSGYRHSRSDTNISYQRESDQTKKKTEFEILLGGDMKQRLADYIADFLVGNGISDVFTVTGGGAMHLNDALGHKEGLHCTYNHHNKPAPLRQKRMLDTAKILRQSALLQVLAEQMPLQGSWVDG